MLDTTGYLIFAMVVTVLLMCVGCSVYLLAKGGLWRLSEDATKRKKLKSRYGDNFRPDWNRDFRT